MPDPYLFVESCCGQDDQKIGAFEIQKAIKQKDDDSVMIVTSNTQRIVKLDKFKYFVRLLWLAGQQDEAFRLLLEIA